MSAWLLLSFVLLVSVVYVLVREPKGRRQALVDLLHHEARISSECSHDYKYNDCFLAKGARVQHVWLISAICKMYVTREVLQPLKRNIVWRRQTKANTTVETG